MSAKVGRNDPCPCGSGKKFKNCCMNLKTEPKKFYTPTGQRKFKAKVIESSSAQEVFAKAGQMVPASEGNPEVLNKLKFKMTDHDFRSKQAVEEPVESSQVDESTTQPKEGKMRLLPDSFEKTDQDFSKS
jgi:hypothetical protein